MNADGGATQSLWMSVEIDPSEKMLKTNAHCDVVAFLLPMSWSR
jgi:hypothetical protein